MSQIPGDTLEAFWTALLSGDDVAMVATDDSYDITTVTVLDDVSAGEVSDRITPLTATFPLGVLTVDPFTLTGVADGVAIKRHVFYRDTGVDATATILTIIDREGGAAMNKLGDGGDISVAYPLGQVVSI